MNKLEEIFKNNTYLLDDPEVKKLIEYCTDQYNDAVKQLENYKRFHDFVLEQTINSNVIVKGGTDCKVVVESILTKLNKDEY